MKNRIATVIIMCVLLATSSTTYAWDYWYSPDSFYDDDENTNSGGLLADGDEPQYGEFDPNSRWIDEVEVKYKESDWSDWGIYDDWWRTNDDEEPHFSSYDYWRMMGYDYYDDQYYGQDVYSHSLGYMDYDENVWHKYDNSFAWNEKGVKIYWDALVRSFPNLHDVLWKIKEDYGLKENFRDAVKIEHIHFLWKPDPWNQNGINNQMFESHDIKLYWDNDKTISLKMEITSDDNAFNSMFDINGKKGDITYIFGDEPDEYNNSTLIDNITGIQYDFYFTQEETRIYPVYYDDGEIENLKAEYKGKCTVVGDDGTVKSYPITINTTLFE